MHNWYNLYKFAAKEKLPYQIRVIKHDRAEIIPSIGDKTINAYSQKQARYLFLEKYPFLKEYLEMGYGIEAEFDKNKYNQRKEQEKLRKIEQEEKYQNSWYYDN
jgi:hypothetical protein